MGRITPRFVRRREMVAAGIFWDFQVLGVLPPAISGEVQEVVGAPASRVPTAAARAARFGMYTCVAFAYSQ